MVGRRDMYSRSHKFLQDLHLFTNCLAVGENVKFLKELSASTTHGGQSVAKLSVPWPMKSVLDCSFSDTERGRQQHKYFKVGPLKICNEKKNLSEIFSFFFTLRVSVVLSLF